MLSYLVRAGFKEEDVHIINPPLFLSLQSAGFSQHLVPLITHHRHETRVAVRRILWKLGEHGELVLRSMSKHTQQVSSFVYSLIRDGMFIVFRNLLTEYVPQVSLRLHSLCALAFKNNLLAHF